MTASELTRYGVVVLVVLVFQHALLDSWRLAGAHADAVILLPIAAGYVAGPERGANTGFVTGLIADLLLPTIFGLSALVGCLLGYATGMATRNLVRGTWWLPVAVFTLASAVGMTTYAILGAIFGEPGMLRSDLAPALAMSVPGAAVMATPVLRLVVWALPPRAATRTAPQTGTLR